MFFTPEEVPVIDTSEILTDDSSNESFLCLHRNRGFLDAGCEDLTIYIGGFRGIPNHSNFDPFGIETHGFGDHPS